MIDCQNIIRDITKLNLGSINQDWAIAIVSAIIGAVVSIVGIKMAIRNENEIFRTQLKEDKKHDKIDKKLQVYPYLNYILEDPYEGIHSFDYKYLTILTDRGVISGDKYIVSEKLLHYYHGGYDLKVKNIGHNLAVSFSIDETVSIGEDDKSLTHTDKINPFINTFAIEKNGEFIFRIIIGFPNTMEILKNPEYNFKLNASYKDILDNIYRQEIEFKAILGPTKKETGHSHVELKIIKVEKPDLKVDFSE